MAPEGGLGDWLAGSARSVTVPGNPAPFGVGRMAVSKTEALRDGMKGRGLQLLHHYPDLLWAMGDKSAPNPGFTPQRVFPLTAPAPAADAEGGDGASPAAAAAAEAPAGEGAAAAAAAAAGEALEGLSLTGGGEAAAAVAGSEGAEAAAAAPAGEAAGPPASMDQILEAAVVAALRRVRVCTWGKIYTFNLGVDLSPSSLTGPLACCWCLV